MLARASRHTTPSTHAARRLAHCGLILALIRLLDTLPMGCLSYTGVSLVYKYTVLIFTRLFPVTGIRLLTTTLRASVCEIAGRAPRVYRVHYRLIHHLAKAVERGVGEGGGDGGGGDGDGDGGGSW